MTVLIDSDILIEVCRGRNRAVVSRWIELSTSDAAVLYSPVSVAELWAGARPVSMAGRQAGAYLQRYRRSHGVWVADALIAANALANNAELWTRNRKHYPMADISFFDAAAD